MPLRSVRILFHTEQWNSPNTVNGNLGIILHAAQEMWKAGHGDWFSNNWEIRDKSRNICVLITSAIGDITSGQLVCALLMKTAIKCFFKKDFGPCPCDCAKLELRRPKVLHGSVDIIICITSISVFLPPVLYANWHSSIFFFKLDLQTQVFPPSPVFLLISVSLAAPFPPYPRSSILRQSLVRHCFQAKSSLPFPHSLTPCVNLDES